MTDIFKTAFYLLKLLARENFSVQHHIMERLDIMLDVKVVESDLAIALKEVAKLWAINTLKHRAALLPSLVFHAMSLNLHYILRFVGC